MTLYITLDEALRIHELLIKAFGGAVGVRDMGLLESALGRPRHQFAYSDPTPDIPALAASCAYGIARNHAFIDGNKRTAYVVCRTFLLLNSFDLTAAKEERYLTFLNLAAGSVSEAELTVWLTTNVRRAE